MGVSFICRVNKQRIRPSKKIRGSLYVDCYDAELHYIHYIWCYQILDRFFQSICLVMCSLGLLILHFQYKLVWRTVLLKHVGSNPNRHKTKTLSILYTKTLKKRPKKCMFHVNQPNAMSRIYESYNGATINLFWGSVETLGC